MARQQHSPEEKSRLVLEALRGERTNKYEDAYPNAYENPRDARIGIRHYMEFYNTERPHSRLSYRTPAEVYSDR